MDPAAALISGFGLTLLTAALHAITAVRVRGWQADGASVD